MANIYTSYTLKGGKVVKIPNAEITKLQKALDCNHTEAVNCWLYDNDYIECPEADKLTAKAKENKVPHNAKAENKPKTQRERVMKEDIVKETIVQAFAEILPTLQAQNVLVEKKGKLITFEVGTDKFKLDLIRQRPPKEGKK